MIADPMPSWYPALAEVADDPGAPRAVRDACRAAGQYIAGLRADRGRLRAAGDALATAWDTAVQMDYSGNRSSTSASRFVDRAVRSWRSVRGDAPSVPAGLPETLASVEDVRRLAEHHGLTQIRHDSWTGPNQLKVDVSETGGVEIDSERLVLGISFPAPTALVSDAIQAARASAGEA